MIKLLQSALLIFIINHPMQAQLGAGIIGTSTIGTDSIGSPAIGKAQTQKCAIPGPCSSTCAVYTFTGSGNWDIEGNWEGNVIPPTVLTGCSQIVINPSGTAECILNIPVQTIPPGCSIIIVTGKRFRIPASLTKQ